MKKVLSALVLVGLLVSGASAVEVISGKIAGMWSRADNGDWSIYVETNTITRYADASLQTVTGTYNLPTTSGTSVCVIIPNLAGGSKNTLAQALTAKALGLTITLTFPNRASTTSRSASNPTDFSFQ